MILIYIFGSMVNGSMRSILSTICMFFACRGRPAVFESARAPRYLRSWALHATVDRLEWHCVASFWRSRGSNRGLLQTLCRWSTAIMLYRAR